MRSADRIDMTDVFSSEEMKLRTPWSKSFQVSPYTHLRMSFGSQIHFLNPATELYDSIDNTLIPCEGGLRNKANGDMRTELLRGSISITHARGCRLSWRIEGAEQVEPKAVEHSEADREIAVQKRKRRFVWTPERTSYDRSTAKSPFAKKTINDERCVAMS